MIKYRVIAISETGAVRDNNEDNLYLNGEWRHGSEVNVPYWHYLEKTTDASLLVVCDGMGGESYGEEASLIAVSGLSAIEDRLIRSSKEDFATLIQSYLLMVNNEICERVRSHHGLRMGTTFASLFIRRNTAQCINLGDSRIYLYRDNTLRQLTVDQTQAQKLADLGLITQAEVKMHPEHNRLVQHLGIFPNEYNLEPALSPEIELQVGDCFLLCSDGLTDMLADEAIRKVLEQAKDIKLAAEDLVQKSILAGGKDNITVILLQIDAFNDERLTKTGKLQVIDPKLALANEQLLAQEALKRQETRQEPLLRMRLNRVQDSEFNVNIEDEVEIKGAQGGWSKLDLLKHPYRDLASIEELQALKEAEAALANSKQGADTPGKKNLYREVVDKVAELPDAFIDDDVRKYGGDVVGSAVKHKDKIAGERFNTAKTPQVDGNNKQHDEASVSETAADDAEATRRINLGTGNAKQKSAGSVMISRVQGIGENASSLSLFDHNRAPIQPITTDDLDRFNQARQAALQRQSVQSRELEGVEYGLKNNASAANLLDESETEGAAHNVAVRPVLPKSRLIVIALTILIILILTGVCLLWYFSFDWDSLLKFFQAS